MAVYVDMLIDYGWKLGPSCHMIADSEDELHSLAQSIGLKRSWFQNDDKHSLPHYDLVESKRKLAISKGAVEIDRYELSRRLKEHWKNLKQQSNG